MTATTDAAQEALDLVGRDPRAALAAADAVVASLPRPRTPDEVRQVAVAQRAAALALRSAGDPAAAEQRVRRALTLAERAGQAEVAAEVRMTMAFVLLDLGRYRAALNATDHALSVLRGPRAARVRTIRALVLHRAGRYREATDEYDAALRVLRRAGDEVWEARLRHNRALMAIELGDTPAALEDMAWSRAWSLRHGDAVDATDTLFNMGVALEASGDVPGALALFDQAEAEWGDVPRPELWTARVDAFLQAGLVAEATASARAAVAWLEGRAWDAIDAHARLQLATCLLVADPPDLAAAYDEAARARAMFARADRREAVAQADYVLLSARLRAGPSRRDLDRVEDALARLRDSGGDVQAADLRVVAGRAARERGDDVRARVLLGPVAVQDRSPRVEIRSRAWLARAMLHAADADQRAADRALGRAWESVEEQRATLGATELRASSAVHAASVVRLGLAQAVARGSAARTFDWIERGRSAALRHAPAAPPRDPELAAALARLRWAVRTDEDEMLEGEADREPGDDLLARHEADVLRLARRTTAEGAARRRPVDAATLAERLDGRRFVHLATSSGRLLAVVVGVRRPVLLDLGELGPAADAAGSATFALRRLLTGFGTTAGLRGARSALRSATQQLDGILAPALGDTQHVVVSSVPELLGVPWSLLPRLRGRSVALAPSATTWCAASLRQETGSGGTVAVAGPRLDLAADEAAAVAATYSDGRAITGPAATVAATLRAAAEADVLHVAAHGRLRRDNPLFSCLDLVDGPLTGYALEALDRVPRTVVLSACSSGAGTTTAAEETLGLAWTLLALGARAVVAPVLPVPDHGTGALMAELHRGLAAGLDAPAALLRAAGSHDDEDDGGRVLATAFVVFGA